MPAWVWAAVWLGLARYIAWLLTGTFSATPMAAPAAAFFTLTYAVSGTALLALGRPRAAPMRIGAVLASVASAMVPAEALFSLGESPMWVLGAVRPSFFIPAFLWAFAAVFPVGRTRPSVWPERVAGGSAGVALVIVGIGLGARLEWISTSVPTVESIGWGITYALSFAALVFISLEARRVHSAEQSRVAWFSKGILLGAAPAVAGSLLLLLVPPALELVRPGSMGLRLFRLVAYGGLLIIPFTTIYAVSSTPVLGAADSARAKLRGGLVEGLAWTVILSPVAIALAVGRRVATTGLTGTHSVLLSLSLLAGIGTGAGRNRIRAHLAEWFGAEGHARVDQIRKALRGAQRATSLIELAGSVRGSLLDLGFVDGRMLLRSSDGQMAEAVDGALSPLPIGEDDYAPSEAPTVMSTTAGKGLDMWANDTGMAAIVVGPPGSATVLAIGGRDTSLPLGETDRRLLRVVWGAADEAQRRIRSEPPVAL